MGGATARTAGPSGFFSFGKDHRQAGTIRESGAGSAPATPPAATRLTTRPLPGFAALPLPRSRADVYGTRMPFAISPTTRRARALAVCADAGVC